MQITSGVGPVEVRSFVAKLARQLKDDVRALGLQIISEIVYGDDEEPRAVHLGLRGDVDRLNRLLGTYVLVARNAERGRGGRKRWFCGVALFPVRSWGPSAYLSVDDIEFSTSRAGGPGGQHVNRTESAVRALHRPSGITVRVASERCQHANKKRAIAILERALAKRQRHTLQEEQRERRAHHYQFQRGNAVRAFRLGRRGRLIEEPVR